ncbi:MAG TPA: hypothetical protein VIY53_04520 [Acidobacteriaceae bacterium]
MRKENENRVLGRLGARELTPEEVERAAGKGSERTAHHTNVITVNPYTGHLDGDGA